MKKRIFSLLLLLAAGHAAAATLQKDGMIGAWETPEPQGVANEIAGLFREPLRDRLVIGKDLSVTLTRRFDDGGEQVLTAPPSGVQFREDLIIVKFPLESGTAKLVLAGWSSKSGKRTFGNLYLYDAGGLFNGIPVSFEPVRGD